MTAKQRFFIKAVVFLAPIALLVIFLEWKLSFIRTSYRYKQELIKVKGADVQTVIFGTSHALYDFDPRQFSSLGLNLANTSESLEIENQLLEKWLSRFPRLKILVINLSYFSFEYRLYGQEDDYRNFFYVREYGISGDGGPLSFIDLRRWSYIATFGPVVTRQIVSSGFRKDYATEINEFGWFDSGKSNQPHLEINERAGRSRAEYHSSETNVDMTSRTLNALRAIANQAQANGIITVFCRAPAYKTYTKYLSPDILSRFEKNMQGIQMEFGLKYIDYLKDGRFSLEDFYDNDHLNPLCAKKFSQIFDQEVLHPLLEANK